MLVAIFWAWRALFRAFKPKAQQQPPPELTPFLREDIDPSLAEQRQTFRQPHALQTVVYVLASMVILVAFLFAFLSAGWNLLSLLLAVAELLLLFTHGAPVLINVTRVISISAEGIESRDVFGRRSISWWEVQRILSADDLSRFRAEGIRSRLTVNTSAHSPETRAAIYRALRSHLSLYQRDLQPWPQGAPLIRFAKANGLGVGLFAAVMILTALVGARVLPQGNVLGLRCAYASNYLREKYDLPERRGCVALRVNEGTGAYRAGLREGDMIVEVEGVPITSGPQFTIYWESLDKHTQKFGVVRPGETDELTMKVTLGDHGRLPEYDAEDPYFFYLRARGADDSSQAIRDFTEAIELAPEFDLAYVYRGALYTEANVPDLAFADLSKALELDPTLTEAYRERAWYHIFTGDYESAAADAEKAGALDGCGAGFETYNYDCHLDHLYRSMAFGERGDPDSLRHGVADAKKAAVFYPERPRSYYLAAYYLTSLERIEEAKDYATTYLQNAADFGEPGNLIDWAQRLVSGSGFPDEGEDLVSSEELEPSVLFVEASADDDIDADGEPTISVVAFSDERTSEPPNGARYLTPDRQYLWAYFDFDNAANVRSIYWEWTQNSYVHSAAEMQDWPGTNSGHAWLRLENRFPNENSENKLLIRFDEDIQVETPFHLRSDPYVGPLTFYADAAATEPLLFYGGEPTQVYVTLEYIGALPKTGLAWFAEKDGAQIAGDVIEVADSGRLTVPLALPASVKPGVVDLRIYLDGLLVRSAALAVAPSEIVASPPFDAFQIGLEPDREGNMAKATKEISRNLSEFRYFIGSFHMPEGSSVTIRWLRNGTPLGFAPETIPSSDNGNALNSAVQGKDGYLEAGEYRVVVSLDTQPVYADVVVVR